MRRRLVAAGPARRWASPALRRALIATPHPSAQEYMALQEALGGALRAGFLSLAQARYSMGADRVSALQIPAHMAATARLRTGAPACRRCCRCRSRRLACLPLLPYG